MSHYTTILYPVVHQYAAELEILDRGAHYFRMVDGLDPLPEWIVSVAERVSKPAVQVFKDAVHYRFSMQFQYNKKMYEAAV